jgi:hypothetical protein
MILNRVGLSALSIVSILVISPIALADTLSNSGSGGYYNKETGRSYSYEYEVWQIDPGDRYTLKIWNSRNYPNGAVLSQRKFLSARDALDHFDCHYAGKEDICQAIVSRLLSVQQVSPAALEAHDLDDYCAFAREDGDESIAPSDYRWTSPYGWGGFRGYLGRCN